MILVLAGCLAVVSPKPWHTIFDHGHSDHGSDHGQSDHEFFGRYPYYKGRSDHGVSDHDSSDHGASDHGSLDHGFNLPSDHGRLDHGASDHGAPDHGASDHGFFAFPPFEHGRGDQHRQYLRQR